MQTQPTTLPVNINGSRIGAYMTAETSRALIARSKAMRAHTLLVRRVEAERGPLVIRGADRRQSTADFLGEVDRRQSARRFER